MRRSRFFGPATLVTAAFIGPGTVTVCTLAGARFGFDLLWALLFSTFATIVLQEMAARLGWVTQSGLGRAIRDYYQAGASRIVFFFVVVSAIIIGNAAYEAGNIGGAVLGLDALLKPVPFWPLVIGVLAFLSLWFGRYKVVSTLLVALVILMSLCFFITALMLRPDVGALLSGLLPLHFPGGSLLTIVALVGTTVVPYNLFLHAAAVSEKYGPDTSLSDIRSENAIAIGLGGLISIAIVVASSAAFYERDVSIESAADMAVQLEPLLGRGSTVLMGLGLFAAGISSAITAPLAAALAARGLFGWTKDWRSGRFRAVWVGVLAIGVTFASLGIRPVLLIQFAQVANGVLLPVIAVFLLFLSNKRAVMGDYCNRVWHNVAGGFVILVALVLTLRALNAVFKFF